MSGFGSTVYRRLQFQISFFKYSNICHCRPKKSQNSWLKNTKRVCINIHVQHWTECLFAQVTLLLFAFCTQMHSNAHFPLPMTSTLTSCMVRLQSLPMQTPLHQCHHHGNHSERHPYYWTEYFTSFMSMSIFFLFFIFMIKVTFIVLQKCSFYQLDSDNITSESGPDLIPFKSFKSRSGQSGEPELLRSVQETLTQH